jgi:hypothetical protein
MKNTLLTLAFILSSVSAFAQVGIGTTSPQATLHIVGDGSAKTGVIFPMITEFTSSTDTALGTVVYYDGLEVGALKNALYIYTSSGWKRILTN